MTTRPPVLITDGAPIDDQIGDRLLLQINVNAQEQIEYFKDILGRSDQEIKRRVELSGGTGIPDDYCTCDVGERPPTGQLYDPAKLRVFLEGPLRIKDADLAECFVPAASVVVPEHTELVPEVWKATPLKKVTKMYGTAHVAALEEARNHGNLKITVRRRE